MTENNNWKKFEGRYTLPGFEGVDVFLEAGELFANIAGIPPGYEMRLEPTQNDGAFIMHGGPLNGAPIQFQMDPNDKPTSLLAGDHKLFYKGLIHRSETKTKHHAAPVIEFTEEKQAAFAAIESQLDGGEILYDLPYPKYEFLRFLEFQENYVFHGSNDHDISLFKPQRSSYDGNVWGNHEATYAASDAIWPLFFAVIHRSRLKGLISNGYMDMVDAENKPQRFYHFTINEESLKERPFTEGMLYILPRTSFQQTVDSTGRPTNEWVSFDNVVPAARLRISPEDFPFLEQIGGHDDSHLFKVIELRSEVLRHVTRVEEFDNGYSLRMAWTMDVGHTIIDFIDTFRMTNASMHFELKFTPGNQGEVWLKMYGEGVMKKMVREALQAAGHLE